MTRKGPIQLAGTKSDPSTRVYLSTLFQYNFPSKSYELFIRIVWSPYFDGV